MGIERSDAVLRQVQTLFSHGALGGCTDRQLLERFGSAHDDGSESAFEVLVMRHGPMVFRVCRDLLDDPNDAQDAFQATFLVLARKVHSIRRRDSVASWLYGIARRVAAKARSAAVRRRGHERRAAVMSREGYPSGEDRPDFRALHEQIDRLPRTLREPVVLCYLEGLSYEAAAGQLGVTEGAVRGRLVRARERLRVRLIRTGVIVPSGLVVAGVATRVASAELVPALIASTVRAAKAGIVTPTINALTRGVLKTMFLSKLRIMAIAVGAVALTAAGVGSLIRPSSAGPQSQPQAPAAEPRRDAQPSSAGKTAETFRNPHKDEFAGVKTLTEAITVLKRRLEKEDRTAVANLLTDENVRSAIPKAILDYEAYLKKKGEANPGTREHFEQAVKPVLLQIAEHGSWAEDCWFTSFTRVDRQGNSGGSFAIRLVVGTPKQRFPQFSLPILDVMYGHFEW